MYRKTTAALLTALLLAGCSLAADSSQSSQSEQSGSPETQERTSGSTEETKDDEFEIDGAILKTGTTELTDQVVKITSGGSYTLTGDGSSVVIDAPKQKVNLILENANLSGDTLPAIYVKKASDVNIQLVGDNTMTYGSRPEYDTLDACLYSKADLSIDGDGNLSITSDYEHGIKAKDTGTFKSGQLTIDAQNDGIHVNEAAVFDGGTYNISAQGEGIEGKTDLTINGGTFNIQAYDDGINAVNSLTVNDGTINVESINNDGIDSNGDLIINGGFISSMGTHAPETAFDMDNTPFEINGGTLFGLGSTGTYPTSATQPVVLLAVSGTVEEVEVRGDDAVICSFTAPEYSGQASAAYLSSPDFKAGETLRFYVNGMEAGTITLSEGVNTIGNIQSMGGGARPGMQDPQGQRPGPGGDGNFQPGQDFNGDFQHGQPPVKGGRR